MIDLTTIERIIIMSIFKGRPGATGERGQIGPRVSSLLLTIDYSLNTIISKYRSPWLKSPRFYPKKIDHTSGLTLNPSITSLITKVL